MAVRWTDRSTTRLERDGSKTTRIGKGWVKTDTGWKWRGAQYYDAKWVKKAITKNESGRTGAPGGRKGELRDRGLSKCLCLGVVSSVMSTSSE